MPKNDESASDPLIGVTVAGRYTIVRKLGSGGMGTVYEAKHTIVARRFAIKFLHPRYATDQDVLRRFENEAKAAGGLEHPNLVAVTDFGRSENGSPYLVMEYLAGEDCATLLRRTGPLAPARAADIVLQACRGLAVAHGSGIVHRDLKPENLFVTDAGDGTDRVKVLDFGIAKLRSLGGDIETSASVVIGTAHYMSPEQVRGAAAVDHRTDLWSLGVVLYELLSGSRPFEGKDLMPVVYHIVSAEPPSLFAAAPDVPKGLVHAVNRSLAKDPMDRYQSARQFADALAVFAQRVESGVPVDIAVPSKGEVPTLVTTDADSKELQHGRRSRFSPFFVAATVGVVLVLAAIANAFLRSQPSRAAASLESAPSSVPVTRNATGASADGHGAEPASAAVATGATPEGASHPKEPDPAMSEHLEPSSNIPAAGSNLARRPARVRPAARATSSAVPPPQTTAGRQPVVIDTASPY